MNRVTITLHIDLPECPDVEYQQAREDAAVLASQLNADVQANVSQTFPPFPSQASSPPFCRVHNSAMKPGKSGGWFCSRKVGDGWCSERVAA